MFRVTLKELKSVVSMRDTFQTFETWAPGLYYLIRYIFIKKSFEYPTKLKELCFKVHTFNIENHIFRAFWNLVGSLLCRLL